MTTPSGRLSNEPGEREREKNASYSGHLRLCQQPRAAHALRSDQDYLIGGQPMSEMILSMRENKNGR